jgi:DNA repair exonuclease SbcCD ATPase subunit
MTISVLLLLASAIQAQSLGDVARQNREQQKAKSTPTTKKVITNDEIPSSPAAIADQPREDGKKDAAAPNGKLSAAEWKSQILAQKNAIASLQAQIDALNKSIYFVEANAYYNGVQYNEYQVKKQKQVAQMQQQLDEQKKRLAEMQEAARQAGMGNAIYDP